MVFITGLEGEEILKLIILYLQLRKPFALNKKYKLTIRLINLGGRYKYLEPQSRVLICRMGGG